VSDPRPIRFRVWDKANRQMFTDAFPDERLGIDLDGRVLLHYAADEGDGYTCDMTRDVSYEYVSMLSTGLRDAAGVEIFEGDVVEMPDTLTKEPFRCLVEWDTEHTGFTPFTDADDSGHWFRVGDCVVIGNVWETPSLRQGYAPP
jgi:uncharacterized phage protein (TIGR01671 family)